MQLFPYPVEMLWNSSFSLVTIPTAFPCLLHAVPYTVCRTTPQLPATALAKDSTSQQQLPVSCDAIMFLYKVGGGEKRVSVSECFALSTAGHLERCISSKLWEVNLMPTISEAFA